MTISKDTPSWMLFEQVFLNLPLEVYPYRLPPMPRGSAINTCIMLNRCQVQWAREQGIPDSMLQRSAKAKQSTDGTWYVEISDSPKRLRRNTSAPHMRALLEFVSKDIIPEEYMHTHAADLPDAPYIPDPHAHDSFYEGLLDKAHRPATIPDEHVDPEVQEKKQAYKKALEKLMDVGPKQSWICPSCNLPSIGPTTGRIITQEDGLPARVCAACVEKLTIRPALFKA